MLLGLDCGSTAVKAVLFSADGTTIATGTRRTEPVQPAPGHVEHDMDRLWQLACAAIAEALSTAPPGTGKVDAIGVTGHGDGLYLCDRAGLPLGPGIQSVDSRAHDVTAGWNATGVLDRVVAITAQRPLPLCGLDPSGLDRPATSRSASRPSAISCSARIGSAIG